IGITPLSTAIRIRGKLVVGNTDTGIVKARYPPKSATVMIRNITDFECRTNQYEDSGCVTRASVPRLFLVIGILRFLRGRGRWLLVLTRSRFLNLNSSVIWEPIRACGHDFVPCLQALDDLNSIILLDAHADGFLMSAAVTTDDHRRSSTILRRQ